MVEITILITDRLAREWRVALADSLKRATGKETDSDVPFNALCRTILFRVVADELAAQAAEAESEAAND